MYEAYVEVRTVVHGFRALNMKNVSWRPIAWARSAHQAHKILLNSSAADFSPKSLAKSLGFAETLVLYDKIASS